MAPCLEWNSGSVNIEKNGGYYMSVLDSFLKVCFMFLAEGMLSKNGLLWRCNIKANNVFACSW